MFPQQRKCGPEGCGVFPYGRVRETFLDHGSESTIPLLLSSQTTPFLFFFKVPYHITICSVLVLLLICLCWSTLLDVDSKKAGTISVMFSAVY